VTACGEAPNGDAGLCAPGGFRQARRGYDQNILGTIRADAPTYEEIRMPSKLNPYLSFRDNARQAMEFYKTVFGGKLEFNTFKEFHASEDPAEADKIMHSSLTADNGIAFFAADTPNSMDYKPGSTISMSLSGDDESELSGYYEKLSADGTVVEPLKKAPWGDTFGMLTDQFGVFWMVNIAGKK
jgi:PhnB protein